jgi:hypothetical protein
MCFEPRDYLRHILIAERFVFDRRHVDRREIARAQQPGDLDGVAAVRFHAIARLLWDQRGPHNLTRPLPGQIPVQPIARRPGLIRKRQRVGSSL